MQEKETEVVQSCLTLRPHGLQPTRLPRPWDFPGRCTGVGCHFLLQRIFPTPGSNLGLPHCKQTPYHLSHLPAGKVQSLIWEDTTCSRALSLNTSTLSLRSGAWDPQLLRPCDAAADAGALEPALHHKRSRRKEKPAHHNWRGAPARCNWGKPGQQQRPTQPKINIWVIRCPSKFSQSNKNQKQLPGAMQNHLRHLHWTVRWRWNSCAPTHSTQEPALCGPITAHRIGCPPCRGWGKAGAPCGSPKAAHRRRSYLNPSWGHEADSAADANPPLIAPFRVKSEQPGWQQYHQQTFRRAEYVPSTSITASVQTKRFHFPTSLQVGS